MGPLCGCFLRCGVGSAGAVMTNTERSWDLVEAYAIDFVEVIFAAPYIKRETLGRSLNIVNRNVKLICLSRWRRREIASGATDRACRELLVERGGEFRLHQCLHAKYFPGLEMWYKPGKAYLIWCCPWVILPGTNVEALCRSLEEFRLNANLRRDFPSESYVLRLGTSISNCSRLRLLVEA